MTEDLMKTNDAPKSAEAAGTKEASKEGGETAKTYTLEVGCK